jgi:type II restriction/modification system DNA methylase subunit YeeA
MNLKTFAQQSRTVLMEGVAKKLLYWGFDENGNVLEEPQKISGGYLLRGEPFDDPNVPALWSALKSAIDKKGIEVVVEEAAYTWFNRMIAVKILAQNGYDEAQLTYVEGMEHTPMLLQRARQGNCSFLEAKEQERLKKIIGDYNKDQEAFALLLTGYCHSHKTLNRVFGKLDDYTELLLPDNMLQDGGFLHLLNTTDAISDGEYQNVELIGWLYQFYISEKKDEVFASFKKNKKAEAKDIPAATQIFTPNWIVKYMVENTAGKIWLDKNPDSALKAKMKYLVENDSDTERSRSVISDVEELTLIDPACGSGHILVEGFDLLYQMYMEEYYTPEEAVASILKNNLFGLDIDDRAAQLATFAILLKAAKVYSAVWTKDWLPQVFAMPEAQSFGQQELKDFLGTDGEDYLEELDDALRLMKQAKNLGSVMKLKLNEEAQTYIAQHFEELKTAAYRDFNVEAVYQSIQSYIPVLLLLTKKYTSVVANPPYMGQKNMNTDLKNYVNAHYPRSKSDLFAVFMESALAMSIKKGYMGMINQHSWMFLSSYEKLRNHILDNYGIVNMLHLGPRTFEEMSGEVVQSTAFILENGNEVENGNYYRLVDYRTVHEKENAFLQRNNEHTNIPQINFTKIPGSPIAYWVSEREVQLFEGNRMYNYEKAKIALQTSDNNRFLRLWFETNFKSIGYGFKNRSETKNVDYKWYPYNKGGAFRKWYGNLIHIVNWWKDGKEIIEFQTHLNSIKKPSSRMGIANNSQFYFLEAVTWSDVTSGSVSFRHVEEGIISDTCAPIVNLENHVASNILLGYLNTNFVNNLSKILNPTLHFTTGNFASLPWIIPSESDSIVRLTKRCVELSKKDWNSFEISWGFEQSPLLNETQSLEHAYQSWQERVTQDFFQLHTNEEELNRIFIDIYGLQEELTSEVPLKDITILQEELAKKDLEALEETFRAQGKDAVTLPLDRSEVISQFISYAIGLFMGRYRLDKAGLNIAHPNPSVEELASYTYNGGQVIIDEDAILPLMGSNCNFPDDALHQIYGLLDTLWGHDTRTENINFIQECLDKDLEKFLVKDFYKFHCSMYKKKPIYWLFSSKKGAFQVLVYMHRMNEFTAEKIRANYLLEQLKHLRNEEAVMAGDEANLSTQEARKLDQIRKDIAECEAYDLELKNVADQQIKIDLDDGVTVNYAKFQSVLAKIK